MEAMRNFLNFLLIHAMKLKGNFTISSKMFVPCEEVLFLTCPKKNYSSKLVFLGKGLCYCLVMTFCASTYIPLYQTSKHSIDFVLYFLILLSNLSVKKKTPNKNMN
jgi:hypothetical protein